ncbi:hypothetical protein D9M72_508090 [compost metagenome]
MELAGAAFVAAQKSRTQLGCRCAGGQHRVEAGGIHDSAGRHEGYADGGAHSGEQLRRRRGAGGARCAFPGQEGGAVAAGAAVLDHKDVRSALHGQRGFRRAGDRGNDRGTGALERAHFGLLGETEREADKLHGIRQQGVDLALPLVVVVEAQPGKGHPVPPGVQLEALPVVLQLFPDSLRGIELRPVGDEEVHAEARPGGAHLADVGLHGSHGFVARGQEAQPACPVRGPHKPGRRCSPCHGCGDDPCTENGARHSCSLW